MRTRDLKNLFPTTVQVTQEMINGANIMDEKDCIGARALKSVLPAKFRNNISWAVSDGGIFYPQTDKPCKGNRDNAIYTITAKDAKGEYVNMMCITEPMEIYLNCE